MTLMAASLEGIILQLLAPNNEAQSQGFSVIREAFKDPNINVLLCECMALTEKPEVLQYAAVLLRKRVLKTRYWRAVPQPTKQIIKQTAIQLFMNRTNNSSVLTAITELIAAIAKHDFAVAQWPDLMQLLNQLIQSNDIKEKEHGLYGMSIITLSAAHALKPHFKSLLPMLSKSLQDTSSINIPFYTIQILTHLVDCIGTEEMNLFQNLVPQILQVIKKLAHTDEEKTCKAMEIFDELVESEVAVIVPHVKPLINFCLQMASTESFQPNIRIKALSIITWLIRLKKKTILKHKLTPGILDVLFPIMCQPSSTDIDISNDDSNNSDDEQSPVSMAGQVIDTMALHLPPEKLIPPLMHHLENGLKSENPHNRKAAYLALAVIAEGCSECIKNKYLHNFLQVICKGIQEENPVVRNAALYCLGQFAQYLQPDISKYASEILPVLFGYLQQTCEILKESRKDPPSLSRTFYALETFCENLENELIPYVPKLMECLITFLARTNSNTAKELALSAIGSVAFATKEAFLPYFHGVIDYLKVFIGEKKKENMTLKIQAIETLSMLARTVGETAFTPIVHDSMVLGLGLVDEVDDPDMRRCIYGLFSGISILLKNNMSQYMQPVVEHMISSLQSTDGINTHYAIEQNPTFNLFDVCDEDLENGDEIDEEEDDDEDIAGFSVENAYMDEKEAACSALKEIAANSEEDFALYLDKCFEEVKKLIESPSADVRREAIGCLGQFCITIHKLILKTSSLEYRLSLEQKLGLFMPKLYATAREDTENSVAIACMETLKELFSNIKRDFVFPGFLEKTVELIKEVFKKQIACQDQDDEDEELIGEEAEYDALLLEEAGDILPALVKTVPSNLFAPYFAGLLPFILTKTKRTCSNSDKSFAIGILADIIGSMESGSAQAFVAPLLPVFIQGMSDEDNEVRSNSVYGLGTLIENVKEALYDQYLYLLQILSNMLATEENPRAKDNLSSTIAKMIMLNHSAIPLNEVFPVFLECLPLKEDMDENFTVYSCLSLLHRLRNPEFFMNLPTILRILSSVLASKKIADDNTKAVIVKLIRDVHSEFTSDFETVLANMPNENKDAVGQALASAMQ